MSNLYYVFGVFNNHGNTPSDLSHGQVAAYYTEVPEAEFGPQAINDNLSNLNWVQEKAVEHQNKLAKLPSELTVIPFKFGSIFSSKEKIVDMLKHREQEFLDLFSQLKNKKEWSLKLYLDESAIKEPSEGDHQLTTMYKELSSASPGKQFFVRKKIEVREKEILKKQINDLRRQVVNMVATSLDGKIKVLENSKPDLDSHQGSNILNLAILAKDINIIRILEPVTSNMEALGVDHQLTGPWPPYNFVF